MESERCGKRECGAQETSCYYWTTSTARWGPQHCLPAADSSESRSLQLLEKVSDEGILCFK